MNVLRVVWDFFLHIFFGTLLFCLIGATVVGLHAFMTWAATQGTSLPFDIEQRMVDLLFVIDALAYLSFIFVVVVKFAHQIYSSLI